ncbi:SDR family NAD(P)-dependent oxidoreductase [Streptomyces sp. NPDC058175]|uniref:SDR family NAD(P)-dependent oxidoreductase n=1 Tax=Streptomyces sp. NPDC058175 TaxID=3346367 RepID=UPI0036E9D5AB
MTAQTTEFDSTDVPDYTTMHRVDGGRFLVLGAGQGIGRQTAHALVANGARVLCVDLVQQRADRVAAELGDAATAWSGDITHASEVIRLVERASELYGSLTGVIDIVGMAVPRDIEQMTEDVWDQQFDICLRHVMLMLRHGLDLLKGVDGASFTFVSSVSALRGSAHNAAYGAAKAALESLVRSAAVEFGPLGIRVNAVAPGIIWTPRFVEILGDEGRRANDENTPLGHIAQPSEIASALLFLSSGMAGHITGQTLVVDGGVNAKFPYPAVNMVRD